VSPKGVPERRVFAVASVGVDPQPHADLAHNVIGGGSGFADVDLRDSWRLELDAITERRVSEAQSAAAVGAAQEQSRSALEIPREAREAAQRQWQPRVFMHAWHGPERGDGTNAAPYEMAVRFYLSNEGTGPAFNVKPWVEIGGQPHTWEDRQYRTMRVDEFCPALAPGPTQPVPQSFLTIGVKVTEWAEDVVYCVEFENLLGERFEVRNYPEATRPADFRRVDPE
jgi:hypothetical protein